MKRCSWLGYKTKVLNIANEEEHACLPCSGLTGRIIFVGVSHILHHHSSHGTLTDIANIEGWVVPTVQVETITCVVPPSSSTQGSTIVTIPAIIITIVCCEIHPVMIYSTTRDRFVVHDVIHISRVSSHVYLVVRFFTLHTECVVFHWIPRIVPQQEFHP